MARKSPDTNEIWTRACREEDRGRFASAFRLYLRAAKAGEVGCQTTVGVYYSDGRGIRRSRLRAMYWYRRAYRRNDYCAANNIGVMYRDEGKVPRALYWFRRAVALGLDDANLEIGKLYLKQGSNKRAGAY